jgi:hypothetical protein
MPFFKIVSSGMKRRRIVFPGSVFRKS